MSLTAGTRLGPYEILGLIGAGGMGEVWRARDPRLGRDVAIKVLPELFARDAERLVRFEHEAKMLAALNHPHIAQIHGLEESSGVLALVMEFVEGEDLAERLQRGPMAVEDALAAAAQMADALEAAHDRGILHRDLKPANVKMTPAGAIKILDFGLAKALAPEGLSATAVNSPTITSPATQVGTILGTAAYMAPEQAKGKSVDKRADIWAFGAVLYEMLTGRRAFDAETVSEVVAAVLTREPDWQALPAGTPPAVRRLLGRCLDRDPRRRLRDIGEARIVLDTPAAPTAPEEAARPRPALLLWVAAAMLGTAGGVWVGYVAGVRVEAPRAAQQLAIQLSAQQEIAVAALAVLTFSPDGSTLVFPGRENGRQYLFRRNLPDREAHAIPGTEDGDAPFFSPDGRWIGFRARRQLMKVPADGGRPFRITPSGVGGVWLIDGTIVYNPAYTEGLFRVPAGGGVPERLTTPDRAGSELGHWWPDVLPRERFVIFTAYREPADRSRVGVLDLKTRAVRWIVDGGFFGRYAPTGHLLYVKGRRLFALPFDPADATPSGDAVIVLDDVFASEDAGFAIYAVSRRGALAYVTAALGNPPREVVWLDREGRRTPATSERRVYRSASLAPDGRRAAVTLVEESRDLWLLSFERGTLSRLTGGEFSEFDPTWSHDGRELFYVVSTPDHPQFALYRIDIGKPDSGRPIWDEGVGVDTTQIAVSPDGRTLAFTRVEPETGANLYTRPLDGSAPARPLRATRAEEQLACFSPDGRFIAYQSDDTGRPEIYVEPYAAGGDRVQISSEGGTQPVWSKSGELFYNAGDQIWVARTRPADRFEFETPRVLFRSRVAASFMTDQRFDVTADGTRILVVTIPEESRPRQIDVLLEWAATPARQNR